MGTGLRASARATAHSETGVRNGILANRAHWGEPGASSFTAFARLIAMIVVVVVGGFSLAIVPTGAANAVVVQWGEQNGTAPSYQADVNGDFLMVGNGVLFCEAAGAQTGYGTCTQLHSATQPTNTTNPNVNDAFRMVNSNTVPGFSTNSSTANVTIPAGATVTKAFLNWSANTGTYAGLTGAYCGGSGFGAATLPAGSATGYLTRAAQLQVGGGTIASYAPYEVLEDATTQSAARYYSATADVTSAFANATTGSAIPISAGNLWTPQGPGCYAGWSLTLIYDYGTFIAGNVNSVPKTVIYYEGHVRQGSADAPLTVDYNGFTAVDTGTRAGFTIYEGDRGITGDTASYRRGADTTFTQIANSAGALGNFGIGRATGSVRYTQTADTSTFTNQSVDVTTTPLTRVVAGDSSVRLQLATSGDSYLLTNSTLSVPTAGLKVEKTFNGTADTQSRIATEPATFTIRLTNTGAGTLQNISVSDDQANCTRTLPAGTTLAPLATFEYTCTAAAGSATGYTSTATATATTVNGGYLASGSDSTRVNLSAIGLTKTSALAAGATGRQGDTVNYTFTATNTGQSVLTGVTITDPLTGLSALNYTWPGTAGTLNPGQSVTATATYTLRQSDVDAGSIVNTATATGTDPDGGPRPTATANRTTPISSAPALAVTKTGALAAGATGAVGDRINYSFTIANNGNVTLRNVALTDRLPGISAITYPTTWPSGTVGTLAPGQSIVATASYVIRQADVDAGAVRNQATATGTTPTNATTTGTSAEVTVPTVAAAPALSTTKSASPASGVAAGSTVTYTITARNTGNTTLTNVAVADPLPGLTVTNTAWPGTAGTLAPGQSVVVTATYTATQANVDAGAIRNTATTTARTPAGATLTAPSAQLVTPTVAAAPRITVAKTGTLADGATGRAGDVVTYRFVIANPGNVTLTGVGVADPLPGLSAPTIPAGSWASGTVGTLRPGDTVTATATYTLRQSDVDAGSVVNTATATGTPPTGANVTGSGASTLPITPTAGITVAKSGVVTSGTGAVGDTVRFDFTIRNTGNVTLSQIALTDTLPGLSTPTLTWQGGTPGTLAPGATATGSATYTIRQSDVDRGAVLNTATVAGRTPNGTAVNATSPQASVPTATRTATFTLEKSGVIAGSGTGVAGDVINYSFTLRNTGNTTLTGVTLADPMPGLSTPSVATWPSGTAGTLRPGDVVTATATYTIRQADVNAGSIANTATATATTSTGATLTRTSTATTSTAPRDAAIRLTQTGALPAGSTGRAGDVITWSFTVTNTGNVTLTGANSIAPQLPGISAVTYGTWPDGATGRLQPGQSVTATATYTVTQADVDAGSVVDPATVTGTGPAGTGTATSSAPATVPLVARGALTITKSAALPAGASGAVGDVVTYSFAVANTGNVTLSGVAVTDPLPGLSTPSVATWPSGTAGTLRPGDTVTATATYTIRQADVDAGTVRNTASVSGRTPTNDEVTATSRQVTVTTAAAAPQLTTTKTVTASATPAVVGTQLTFTVVGRNSGNVTLTGVSVADSLEGFAVTGTTWSGGAASAGTLAPGATVTVTGTYTVTQADVDRGSVANTGTTRGSFGAVEVQSAATVSAPTVAAAPSVVLTKTGTRVGTGTPQVGDVIQYAFQLRNSGNVTLTTASITDPLPGLQDFAYDSAQRTLAPGETLGATATYRVTQADLDAGAVVNTATGSGRPPTGAAVTQQRTATVPLTAAGTLTLDKSSTYLSGTGAVGSVIRYSFVVTNQGNVTLSDVAVTDPRAGLSAITYANWSTPGTLAPGQSVTGTADYTVTQADVNAGGVTNTATASGRTPTGTPATASDGDTRATVAPDSRITTAKSATVTGGGAVGDRISYTIVAENTGNTTLTGVTVTDPMFQPTQLNYGAWPSGITGTLQPGQRVTVTASKVITQADVDRGEVLNTATASATTPSGGTVDNDSDPVTATVQAAAPEITLTQTGTLPSGSPGRAGDVVTFTFTVRNTGNQTLTGTDAIDRSLPGIGAVTFGTWPSGTTGTLRPGDAVTGTATYTLTQADVDAGSITDVASVTGTTSRGATATDSDPATVTFTLQPSIVLEKSGQLDVAGAASEGDDIRYTFTLRNSGNVTLSDAFVDDPLLTGAGAVVAYAEWASGTAGVLRPGDVVTGTALYPITQADFNRGRVSNTASVDADGPAGSGLTATDTSDPVIVATGDRRPGISIEKTASVSGARGVGDVITYTFTVVNTGNVDLIEVALTDVELDGLGPIVYSPQWPGGPDAPRGLPANGGTGTATAQYVITQADVDRGFVTNRAFVEASTVSDGDVIDVSPQIVTRLQPAAPALSVVKTGAVRGGGDAVLDSVIDYTITVDNTGNLTLSDVTLSDPLLGDLSATALGTMAPDAAPRVVTGSYVVTQADVDAGSVLNVATATAGTPNGGAPVSASGADTQPIASTDGIELTKTAEILDGGDGSVGDVIEYTFTATNTGTTTLREIAIADEFEGLSDLDYGDWPTAEFGVLPPGESITATATYQVLQADVDAGLLTNTATVSAANPGGEPVADASPEVETALADAEAELVVRKTVTSTGTPARGDLVRFAIEVENTGNVTVDEVELADALPGLSPLQLSWPGAEGVLAPGEVLRATAQVTVTQADVNAGQLSNTATASGTERRDDTPVSASGSVEVDTVTPNSGISVTDRGELAAGATGRAGDEVVWTYVVTNDGNTTLTAVDVTELLPVEGELRFEAWPDPARPGVLEPGQSITVRSTTLLTQSQVDAGVVRSEVTATGTGPGGAEVDDVATDEVEIERTPELTAVKTGRLAAGALGQVGDRVDYRLEITNTGNVSLYRGNLVDPMENLGPLTITWPSTNPNGSPRVGFVAPGDTVVGVAQYTIQPADIDRGYIENTAEVEAYTAPTGGTRAYDASNTVIVNTVQASPQLVTTVEGVATGTAGIDDVIEWTIVVRNAGNVTVSDVVADLGLDLDDVTVTWPGADGILPAGATVTIRGTTPITQADVDAGSVILTAQGSGTPARGPATVQSDVVADTVPTQGADPELVITKDAQLNGSDEAGEFVTFTYTLTNEGNVTVFDVNLADELPLVYGVQYDWSGAATPFQLAPGETVTATARYALRQADVDAGGVTSAVTGRGTLANGTQVSVQASDGVTIEAAPDAVVTKTGTVVGDGGVGSTIEYDFTVRNTGNVTLTLVELTDALPGVSAPDIVWPGTPGTLLPEEELTATAVYTIRQSDVDRGTVLNTATASGKPPVGDVRSWSTAEISTAVQPAAPAITVDKAASTVSGAVVGTVIDYTITVVNSGNVTLRGFEVVDELDGLSALSYTWPERADELAPGDVLTVLASYRVTQADVDRGSITNDVEVAAEGVRAAPDGSATAEGADSVTTAVAPTTPSISVVDSGALAPGATGRAGDQVNWAYLVRNTGQVTLTGVEVDEQLDIQGGYVVEAWPDPARPGVLAPGESVRISAVTVLTQAQVDAQQVVSEVTASGAPPSGDRVDDTDTATVPIASRPELTAVKTGQLAAGDIGQVGDRVDYRLEITNTGNVSLYRGNLVDPMENLGPLTITWPSTNPDGSPRVGFVAPGDTVVGVAQYTIQPADIDRGYIENTAEVEAYTAPTGGTRAYDASNTVVVNTVLPSTQLVTTVEGVRAGTGVVGDEISWTIVVRNDSNVTVENVQLEQSLTLTGASFDWPTATPGTLPPGAQVVLTGTTTITQADIDRGGVTDTVTATGEPVRGPATVTSNTATDTVPTVAANPSIQVTDTGAITSGTGAAGDRITFTYLVVNDGNVTLDDVAVRDTLSGIGAPVYPGGTPVQLLPGEEIVVAAEYVITQQDVDAGSVISTVTASGTPPVGAAATDTASATVPLPATDGLRLEKTGTLRTAGQNGVGDTIDYRIRIVNEGTVTARDVALNDALPGLTVPVVTWPTAEAGVIPPGTAATATASYQIAQRDVDAGEVLNTATVRGTSARGTPLFAVSPQDRVETEAYAPAYTVVKTGSVVSPGTGVAGDTVLYRFTIQNTGNVTLTNLDLTERLAGATDPVVTYAAGSSIAPNARATATATYTLTVADVNRGYVDNTADAVATTPDGDTVPRTSNTFRLRPAAPAPLIEATQTAALEAGDTGRLGDWVTFTYTLRNTGNVTLTDLEYTDTVAEIEDVQLVWSGAEGSLDPGQTLTITGRHQVTQADVDAGRIVNDLTGSGRSPANDLVSDGPERATVQLAPATASMSLAKTGTPEGAGLGDRITYTLTLRNTGEVTLRDAAVIDPLAGLGALDYDWPTDTEGVLPVGEAVVATAGYTVTQADIDRGAVLNTATATALTPGDEEIGATSPESVLPLEPRAAEVQLGKTMTLAPGATGKAGDVVRYSFTIENTGNVTLEGLVLGDPQPGLSDITIDWGGSTAGVLAPGDRATGTASYVLTQADVDAGSVGSTAEVTGTAVGGGVAADTASDEVTIAARPSMTFDKSRSFTAPAREGTEVTYRFTATNTGNVTLSDVQIADELTGLGEVQYVWPTATDGVLAPGATVTATATYTVTAADVTAGSVVNSATISGTPPTGAAVSVTDSTTVSVPNRAAIDIVMSVRIADGDQGYPGDRLVYTYVITNTGDRPLTGVQVVDDRAGLGDIEYLDWPGEPGVLQPGESVTAVAYYVISPAEAGGVVEADAQAVGLADGGVVTVTDVADAEIDLPTPPSTGPTDPTDPVIPGVPGGLANTGTAVLLPAGSALLLLLSGLIVIVAGSRRRRKENA